MTTIIYYPIPIHRQPAYAHLNYAPGSPITESLCSRFQLADFPELSDEKQSRVIEVLHRSQPKHRSNGSAQIAA